MPRPPSRPRDDYEDTLPPIQTGGNVVGWALYAMLALVGFCFGAWAGNQRPKVVEVVKTVPAETKPAPEKKEPDKKDPPVVKQPDPTPMPEPKPKEPTPMVSPEPKPKEPTPEPKPKEPSPEPKPMVTAVAFDKEIQPIFKSKCMLCHGDTKGVKGGLDLRTLASIKKGGESGDALVPGNLEKSIIWTSIMEGAMPPPDKPQLTDAEKMKIKNWILSGGK